MSDKPWEDFKEKIDDAPWLAYKPQPEAPKKSGLLSTIGTNLVAGAAGTVAGAGSALTGMMGADQVSDSLKASKEYWQKQSQETGGDTFAGKVANIVGGIAPALLFPEAVIPNMVATAGLFAIPAVKDTYEEKKKEGMSDGLAAAHAALAGGINMFAPGVAARGSKAIGKLAGAGEGAASQLGLSAVEGAGFAVGDPVLHKLLNVAAVQPDETPWAPPVKDILASAAAFPIIRGAGIAAKLPEQRAAEKVKADAAAAAEAKTKAATDAETARRQQDPAYAQSLADTYFGLEQQKKDMVTALVKPVETSPTFSADMQVYKDAEADINRFQKEEVTPAAQAYLDVKPVLDAAEAAKPPPPAPDLAALTTQRDAVYKQRDAANAALKAAKDSGDMAAAQKAQDDLQQFATKEQELTAIIQPLLPPAEAPATEANLARLNKAHDAAVAGQKWDRANALLKQIGEVQQRLATQKAIQKQTEMAFPEAQGSVPGRAGIDFTQPVREPTTNAPLTSEQLLTNIAGRGEGTEAQPFVGQKARVPAAPEPVQEAMFPETGVGGIAPEVGKPSQLLAQIDQLKLRPNMPAQTLTQLESYAKALSHPAMEDASNTAAQNALEIIGENVGKIAYQGAGQGVERAMSPRELQQKIAGIDARLQMLGNLEGSIAEAKKAFSNASFEEQPARHAELQKLQDTARQLVAERQRLQNEGTQVNLTPYARQQKDLTTIGEGTAIAGEATAKQQANAQKWIAGEKTVPGAAQTGHPQMTGREVIPVNRAPETERAASDYLGAVDAEGAPAVQERIAAPATSLDRGLARVERVTERTIGVDRKGPQDAELARELQAMAPADRKTFDLFDSVYGSRSKAERLVDEAHEGLQTATSAVRTAETALDGAKTLLAFHTQELAKVLKTDPVEMQRKALEGGELEVKRKMQLKALHAKTAGEVAVYTKRTVDAQVEELQAAVAAAHDALRKTKATADAALVDFKAEWARLKNSGKLSDDLWNFIKGRDLDKDVTATQQALADVLERSGSPMRAATAKTLVAGVSGRAETATSAEQAQALIQAAVPQVRNLMGPRVATIVDNLLRLQAAKSIMSRANTLLDKYTSTQLQLPSATKSLAEKVKAAQAAINARGESLSMQRVRLETAFAEVRAAQTALTAYQEKLAAAPEVSTAPATLEAKAKVAASQKRVEAQEQALSTAKETAVSRIEEARTNLKRAQETRKEFIENEQAAREGKPSPLVAAIEAARKITSTLYNTTTESLLKIQDGRKAAVAEVGADIATHEKALADLQRVENEVSDLWQQQTREIVDIDERIATLVDTSALMQPSEFMGGEDNAQRTIDRGVQRAELKDAGKEEAEARTERDTVLGNLEKLIAENTALLEKPESDAHRKALEAHRNRLLDQYSRQMQVHAKRIAEIRKRIEGMDENLATMPEAESKQQAQESLDILQGQRSRLQFQLDEITAYITSIRAEREKMLADVKTRGEATTEQLRELGANDPLQRHAALRYSLMKSLELQRKEAAAADADVEVARQLCDELQQQAYYMTESPMDSIRAEYQVARKEYDAAVARRARAADHALELERNQLELIAALPPLEKPAPAPKKLAETLYENYKGEPHLIGEKYEEPTGQVPEAVGATARELERGALRPERPEPPNPELDAFKQRIEGTTKVAALRKELGGLRSAHEALIEAAQEPAGRKLTTANARALQSNASWMAKESARISRKTRALQEQADLFDRIKVIEDRLMQVQEGRGPSLQRLVESQPAAGRRGTVMKKSMLAGEMIIGDRTPVAERNLGGGRTLPATTVSALSTTGTRNKPTEPIVHKQESPESIAKVANKATGKGTQLRADMTQAQLERNVDTARAERAQAQERYDAVMAAPKASDAVKAHVAAQLEAAKKAAAKADEALAKGTETGTLTQMSEGEDTTFAKQHADETGTLLTPETRLALHDGNVAETVAGIIKNASTPEVARFAENLLPHLEGLKLGVDENVKHNGESVAGLYDEGANRATMHPDRLTEEDTLHELTHAATATVLNTPDAQLAPHQVAAKRGLTLMWESVRNSPIIFGEDYVGKNLNNVKEFASEVYSNPTLRAKMDSVGKPTSLLQRFATWVARMFGKGKTESEKAVDLVTAILSPARMHARGEVTPSLMRQTAAVKFGKRLSDEESGKWAKMNAAKSQMPLALEQKLVDMRAALRRTFMLGDSKLATEAHGALLQNDAATGMSQEVLAAGALGFSKDAKGHTMLTAGHSKSGKDVLEAIEKMPGRNAQEKLATFHAGTVTLRANDVGWDKLGFDAKEIASMKAEGNAALAEINADPKMKAAFDHARDVYRDLNQGQIRALIATDAIPKDVGQAMLNDPNYVPFYRRNGDDLQLLTNGHPISIGDIRHQPFLHALLGGDTKLMPFHEAMFKNVALLTNMAVRNTTDRMIAYHFQELGKDVKGDNGKPAPVMQIKRGWGDNGQNVLRFRQAPDPRTPTDDGKRHIVIDTKGTAAEYIPTDLLAQSVAGSYTTLPGAAEDRRLG